MADAVVLVPPLVKSGASIVLRSSPTATIAPSVLGTGTADATKFLQGDGAWVVQTAGGWTDDGTTVRLTTPTDVVAGLVTSAGTFTIYGGKGTEAAISGSGITFKANSHGAPSGAGAIRFYSFETRQTVTITSGDDVVIGNGDIPLITGLTVRKDASSATGLVLQNQTQSGDSETRVYLETVTTGIFKNGIIRKTSGTFTPANGMNAEEFALYSTFSSVALIAASANAIRFVTGASPAERMRVLSTGGVAINTTTLIGAEQLRVNGDILSDANILFRSGTAFTGTFDHAITVARTWTIPDSDGVVVLDSNTQILSNKTLSTPSISGPVSGTYSLGGTPTLASDLSINEGINVILGTVTGTKWGTAATQKQGWWNATPVIQDTGWAISNVTTDRIFDANATTLDEIADVLGTVINTMKTYGILGA